jgi:hypothetical protein
VWIPTHTHVRAGWVNGLPEACDSG